MIGKLIRRMLDRPARRRAWRGLEPLEPRVLLSTLVAVELRPLTTPTPAEVLTTLPDPAPQALVGEDLFLEVWLQDLGPPNSQGERGIAGAQLDIAYDTALFDATDVALASAFQNPSYTIDEAAGLVSDIAGFNFTADLGAEPQWAKFATITFTPTAIGAATFASQPGTAQIARWGAGNVPWADVSLGTADIASVGATTLDIAIGDGGARSLAFTDADGTPVQVRVAYCSATAHLAGDNMLQEQGTRGATVTGQNIQLLGIDLANTTTRSSLTITTRRGGDGKTTIGDISADGPLRTITARTTDLLGDIAIAGPLGSARLADVADHHDISIGGTPDDRPLTLYLGQVQDLVVQSGTPIRSLTATEWLDADATPDRIVAPWLGTLRISGNRRAGIAGHFQAGLDLSGNGARRYTLSSVRIAGDLMDADWDIAGDAGSITAYGTVDDWTLAVHSDLRSLRLGDVADATVDVDGTLRSIQATRWQQGSLAAKTIGSLRTRGDRRNAIPGDFDATLTLTGDPDARRTLTSVRVAGPVDGTAWDIAGDAGSITIYGAVNDWTLKVHSDLRSLRLGDVADANVDVDGTLRSIQATRWQQGSLAAKTVGSLRTRGDRRNAIPGDFDATLTLTGDPNARRTLNSARVAGAVDAATWDITGDAGSITIYGAVDNWALSIHSDLRSLRLGDVADATVDVDGTIRSVQATRWQQGSLTAKTVGSLRTRGDRRSGIAGDFGAALTLAGDPDARRTLTSATVAGGAGGAAWDITGDAGSISIYGAVDNWALSIHSDLRSLRLGDVALANVDVDGTIRSVQATRWQQGSLSAKTIGSLRTRGDRRSGIAGDFGASLTLAGDPDARYTLTSATISGTLGKAPVGTTLWQISGQVNSVSVEAWGADTMLAVGVEAGLDGLYLTGDDSGSGGTLRSLRINNFEDVGAGLFGVSSDDYGTIRIAGERLGPADLPYEQGDFRIVMV